MQIKDSDSNIEKIVDIGFVGQPTNVKNDLIMNHINKGEIPVIAPLGIDAQNNSYNINADTVAGFIAGTIKASKLLLLTDCLNYFETFTYYILNIHEAFLIS